MTATVWWAPSVRHTAGLAQVLDAVVRWSDHAAATERLRSLVCALEEECAAREADGERLAKALDGLHGVDIDGGPLLEMLSAAATALDEHDDLTHRAPWR